MSMDVSDVELKASEIPHSQRAYYVVALSPRMYAAYITSKMDDQLNRGPRLMPVTQVLGMPLIEDDNIDADVMLKPVEKIK